MKTKTFNPILAILIAVFLTNMYWVQAQKKQTKTNGEAISIHEKEQEKIVQDLLEAFNLGAENVLELFDEEAIIEYPYAYSLGTPSSLNKTQYANYLKGALANMPDITFSQVKSYTTENHIVWAEFHGEVIIPSTNKLYQQDYVARFTLKNGKIIHYKEYWNPMAVSAMGDHKEVNEMFNDKSKQ
ncbi:nuclear transport factor 2 family protein [Flavivirga amylovorans]|uniref:Nuclear transport factor 2 family protein n=1 Tax=Flavivirga amylovorans TaxID=870486 RepID=A0ABT8WVZ2_9FLAO|nr:nuclear transport factor 2 family protein [Flavivirga amylovorans]MDO5985846.1 nuclear transport factor 2 family protein [Flavivirga amylovorans]